MGVLIPQASAEAPIQPKYAPPQVVSIDSMITQSSEKWGVNRATVARVVSCESGYKIDAIGDHGTSFGIVQIHLPAHPEISKEQALNPEFSIDYLAKEISFGRGGMWSCYTR